MSLSIFSLPAFHGDSFLIKLGDDKKMNILVDGGIGRTYPKTLKGIIEEIKSHKEIIDLLIITHIDDDHIGGIKAFFEDTSVDKSVVNSIWFNSGNVLAQYFNCEPKDNRNVLIGTTTETKVSLNQARRLENEIKKIPSLTLNIIQQLDVINIGEAKLTVLSPDIEALKALNEDWQIETGNEVKVAANVKDYEISIEDLNRDDKFIIDKSKVNRASIAFLLEFRDKKIIMSGDAHPDVITKGLNRLGYTKEKKLKLDAFKLSHHGSCANTDENLLHNIECRNFIISTDGRKHGLPNKRCLSRIIKCYKGNIRFYFNYQIGNLIFTEREKKDFSIICDYENPMEV